MPGHRVGTRAGTSHPQGPCSLLAQPSYPPPPASHVLGGSSFLPQQLVPMSLGKNDTMHMCSHPCTPAWVCVRGLGFAPQEHRSVGSIRASKCWRWGVGVEGGWLSSIQEPCPPTSSCSRQLLSRLRKIIKYCSLLVNHVPTYRGFPESSRSPAWPPPLSSIPHSAVFSPSGI